MAVGTGSSGEGLTHFNAIRLRVIGDGNLLPTFYSEDEVNSESLYNIPLQPRNEWQPTRIANTLEQRAYLELKTTEINEYFRINRVIIFAKTVYTDLPAELAG